MLILFHHGYITFYEQITFHIFSLTTERVLNSGKSIIFILNEFPLKIKQKSFCFIFNYLHI